MAGKSKRGKNKKRNKNSAIMNNGNISPYYLIGPEKKINSVVRSLNQLGVVEVPRVQTFYEALIDSVMPPLIPAEVKS